MQLLCCHFVFQALNPQPFNSFPKERITGAIWFPLRWLKLFSLAGRFTVAAMKRTKKLAEQRKYDNGRIGYECSGRSKAS